ncbi:hypothetical protein [Bradyrhizobium zhanjiangense]|uniref:Uncharacterized protein n=1 Tax=Bradyrhizobium zhanjiangense TaxID=1325107 RepID=A0A4Q0SA18_9BRAD|nr:hypothetical protein [Bradyrhizobium zhanjiangense]RXH31996.1 hypothetical protein XH94_32545 [Bradyrhizobium zhanjiangense]
MSEPLTLSELFADLDDLSFRQIENLRVLVNALGCSDLAEISDPDVAGATVANLLESDPRAAAILNAYWKTRPKPGSAN